MAAGRNATTSASSRRRDSPGREAVARHAPQQVAVQPHDGEDGAELDDDLERIGARAHESQRVTGQDQVAGGGDGKELGRTLDQTEDDRGDDVVHALGSAVEGGGR